MNNKSLCYGCFAEISNQDKCPFCNYQNNSCKEATLNLTPGTILAGKYLIGRALGQGGFGITYLGWDIKLDMKLAIKEFFPQGLVSRAVGDNTLISLSKAGTNQFSFGLERFLLEAKTLARFNEFPGIVTVRDYFEENDTAYLVMNYHEGVTLNSYLDGKGGRVSIEEAISIYMPVLDALKEVHGAGILHRDISPDNLLINDRGQVVLIDFGAARQAIGEKSKSLSVIMKAGYTPLEQYQSKGKQGPWTDLYSVAASIYRSITGISLPEAFDRLENDPIKPPSTLGVDIKPHYEKILFKALAVKAEDRYQTVEEFQDVLSSILKKKPDQDYCAGNTNSGQEKTDTIDASDEVKGKPGTQSAYKKFWLAIGAACIVLGIFASMYFINGDSESDFITSGDINNENLEDSDIDSVISEQKVVDDIHNSLDADYIIVYEDGDIRLGDLSIGSRIVDPLWEWEHRVGDDYTGSGEVKPVVWIVVAKDHYDMSESHVTLITEELIGRHAFDDSTDRRSDYGNNHWGDSGTTNADHGLRPWLNSSGIDTGEGFYEQFSNAFKDSLIITSLTNRQWRDGSFYNTEDKVFIPSLTEMGDTEHLQAHVIGEAYPYFFEASDTKLVASIGGENWWYWTRSTSSRNNGFLNSVFSNGRFMYTNAARHSVGGVRPVINLKADIMVSEIAD